MGEDRPYSEIELRRLAKQQRSPEFRAWLDREPEDLAQLVILVPALAELDDPWTVPGLAAIEDAAMARFPNPGPTATDEEMAYLALCARGIGHTYLHSFGPGKWVWVKILEGNPIGPALELPGHEFWFDPGESIRDIIFDRRPGWLAEQSRILADWTRTHTVLTG
ncbi:hypothetical protein AB0I35_14595 [Nocardia sp. NPDC050378]|uniref:hypothetical protein n=1 Tax=Nocardia sp. NPDC050378 TaxID=3155400 RepID=UPI0033BFF150